MLKVRGLCGTLTWNQHDDFTTSEGDVENSVASFAGKFTRAHCALPQGTLPDPCTTYTQRRQYAETACSVIHGPVFQVRQMKWVNSSKFVIISVISLPASPSLLFLQACHDVVEREPYFRLCLSEVCGCSPKRACHCNVLTAYARHCAQEGVLVHWRNQTFCREFVVFPCHLYPNCGNLAVKRLDR